MPARRSPTERIRAQIDELFAGGQPLAETLEEAARLSVRLVIQVALEAEVSEFLGRDRSQRDPTPVRATATAISRSRSRRPPARSCWNVPSSALPASGWCPGCWARRQPHQRAGSPGAGQLRRGLSVRDVEAALAEALGPQAALSKSTVWRICQVSKQEFDAFATGDLGGVEVDDLFLDGAHFRYHPGAPAGPVLVAWGVTTSGGPVLVGLAPASDEAPIPGLGSWRTSPAAGWVRRCWSSPMARPGGVARSSWRSRARCGNAA